MQLNKYKKWMMIYISILIFTIPIIVFIKEFNVPKDMIHLMGEQKTVDIFTYYKALFFNIFTFIGLILFIFFREKIQWELKKDKFTLSLLIFAISIIISTIFSEYKQTAIFGQVYRFEGLITWLNYLSLSFMLYHLVKTKEDIYSILKTLCLSAFVISIIGALQTLNLDIYKTSLGRYSFLGPNYYYNVRQEDISFSAKVYSTLYNPNMIGAYVALLVPISVGMFINNKYKKSKWAYLVLFVLLVVMLLGAISTGGIIALIMEVAAVLVILFIYNKKYFAISSIIVVIVAVLALQVPLVQVQIGKVKMMLNSSNTIEYGIKDIDVDGLNLTITSSDDQIRITHNHESFFVYNSNNEELDISIDSNGEILLPEEITGWKVKYNNDQAMIEISSYNKEKELWETVYAYVCFGGFSFYNEKVESSFMDIEKVDVFKNERVFSNRGYIWNRTLPLIAKKPIIGYGPDQFTLAYNQYDIVGKLDYIGNQSELLDKPHNFYLNILINFGFVGLIIVMYIIIRAFILDKSQFRYLSISLVGYLVSGIVYDSALYVTFIMFIVIALMYASNNVHKSRQLKSK